MLEGKKYDEACNELNLKVAINEDKKTFYPHLMKLITKMK